MNLLKNSSLLKTAILGITASVLMASCSKSSEAPTLQADQTNSAEILQPKSISRFGLENTMKLALTFDDGPTPQVTEALLDLLRDEGIKATFFVQGSHVHGNENAMARMRDEGHIIANHTLTHQLLKTTNSRYVSPEAVRNEIYDSHLAIMPYISPTGPLFFRAPGGEWNGEYTDWLNSHTDLRRYIGPIYWNVGGVLVRNADGSASQSADWDCWRKRMTSDQCAEGYMKDSAAKRGGVVLMHDVHMKTVEMVRKMIPEWRRRGYTFIGVDDIRTLDKYADDAGYNSAYSRRY